MKFQFKKITKIDVLLMSINPKYYPMFAFLLTAIIYLVNLSAIGVLGNGMNTINTSDLRQQIIPYIFNFFDVLKGKHSFWYSWNFCLGSGGAGSYAYYAMSPFNIFYFLLGKNHLELASALMIVSKASVAAMTFQFFIMYFLKNRYFETVLFSVMYGLCGFSVCYYLFVLLSDGFLIFPVIILGILMLYRENKIGILIFGYTYIFIVQFYIGYIVGLSSFIFFVVFYFYRIKSLSNKISILFKYGFAVLISLGLSAFIWLPALKQILEMGNFSDIYSKPFSNNLFFIFSNMFVGQNQLEDGFIPYIYCGTISVISMPLFFLNNKINLRKKKYAGIMILIFLLFFLVPTLNYVLHGFDQPNMVGYRYAYVFSFIVLSLLSIEYPYLRDDIKKHRVMVCGLIILHCISFWVSRYIFMSRMGKKYNEKYHAYLWYIYIIELAFIILWVIAFRIYKNNRYDWLTKRTIISFLLIFELSTNIFICLKNYHGLNEFAAEYYSSIHNNTMNILNKNETENKKYRYIYEDDNIINIALLYDKSSLGFFTSVINSRVVNSLVHLGFYNTPNHITGNGWTPVTASLLGIDAVVDGGNVLSDDEKIPVVLEANEHYYQNYIFNSRVLPIAFAANEDILKYKPSESALDNQNQILSLLTGQKMDCFENTDVEINTDNAKIEKTDNGIRIWNLGYPENEGYVVYSTTEGIVKPVYANLYNKHAVNSETRGIPIRPSSGNFMSNLHGISLYPNQVFRIDVNKDGDGNFTLILPADVEYVDYENGYYAYYDSGILDKAYELLNNNRLENLTVTDGRISGNIDVTDDAVLFTSIPYEHGWNAYVDGCRVDITPIIEDAFIGIKLDEGKHDIILEYIPPLRNVAFIISILSIATLFSSNQIKKDGYRK